MSNHVKWFSQMMSYVWHEVPIIWRRVQGGPPTEYVKRCQNMPNLCQNHAKSMSNYVKCMSKTCQNMSKLEGKLTPNWCQIMSKACQNSCQTFHIIWQDLTRFSFDMIWHPFNHVPYVKNFVKTMSKKCQNMSKVCQTCKLTSVTFDIFWSKLCLLTTSSTAAAAFGWV